jgi:acyl-CoA synthetase (NDP forming)
VPVYVSRFGGTHLAPRALKVYEEAGIPVLDAPDRATQAIAAVMSARRAIGRR